MSRWKVVDRAAGPDGEVVVKVTVDGDLINITVEDSGPGFGSGAHGACGIGLTVVERYARRHGGVVDIARSGAGGAAVSFSLAASPA